MSAAASAELYEAVRRYEERRPGLGAEFFDAVTDTLEFVERNPRAGSPVSACPETYRYIVRRFPYQVVYRLYPAEILIVAVAHSKRRPNYWTHRA